MIGQQGGLPWHLPDDLKRFKAVTLGKPILMGRRTYESIGRPLAGRRNLVLTRRTGAAWPGVECVSTLQEACGRAGDVAELCVIGGAEVYALALPFADSIYLTQVHASPAGDTRFPLDALAGWQELERQEHPIDARHAHAMSFTRLVRPSVDAIRLTRAGRR